ACRCSSTCCAAVGCARERALRTWSDSDRRRPDGLPGVGAVPATRAVLGAAWSQRRGQDHAAAYAGRPAPATGRRDPPGRDTAQGAVAAPAGTAAGAAAPG